MIIHRVFVYLYRVLFYNGETPTLEDHAWIHLLPHIFFVNYSREDTTELKRRAKELHEYIIVIAIISRGGEIRDLQFITKTSKKRTVWIIKFIDLHKSRAHDFLLKYEYNNCRIIAIS